jgi:hypothetical protein
MFDQVSISSTKAGLEREAMAVTLAATSPGAE